MVSNQLALDHLIKNISLTHNMNKTMNNLSPIERDIHVRYYISSKGHMPNRLLKESNILNFFVLI